MKNFSKLDQTASRLILICTMLIGLVIFLGAQAGIRVRTNLPDQGLIGPYQTIRLTFSAPVESQMAEALFDIQPEVDGVFNWIDPRTLQFVPSRPFELNTSYKMTLHTGSVSLNDHQLKKDHTWNLQVREPLVAYLNVEDDQSSIWVTDLNHTSPRQLTDPSQHVMGFDASRDGEFVVFYVPNESGGVDLWRTSRQGESAMLLDCGRDRCTTPAISPDGTQIAYAREIAGPGEDLPYGSPRVWVLNTANGQDGPVYEDQQVLGYHPVWSPDGTQLASFDGLADQIRLLNIQDGEQFIFSSGTGGPVTWSPDGKKFLFTDVEQSEGGVRTRVRMADLTLNETFTLIGSEDDMDYGYHSMTWSPLDQSAVVLGMRAGGEDPSQVFWLFNPQRLDGIIIAGEPDYAYNLPHWNIWGDALVFQQFKLKGVYQPQIGLWKAGSQEPQIIAEGLMPHWLP
jgi:hypothetical protein